MRRRELLSMKHRSFFCQKSGHWNIRIDTLFSNSSVPLVRAIHVGVRRFRFAIDT